jgi:tRNA/rRNA methyltransferase
MGAWSDRLRSEKKQGMIAPMSNSSAFREILSRVRFVLVEPSHPGNVGASARALQAMGFDQLWLVNPEDPKIASRSDAVALSSGAARVLGESRIGTLEEALGPATWSCAMSARVREFEPPRLSLEQACESLVQHLSMVSGTAGTVSGTVPDTGSDTAAFVFGPERSGLSNDHLLQCRHVCSLDVEEKFSSLNLSQAVQVVAYALRRAARSIEPSLDAMPSGNNRETAKPANHEMVEGLHAHLIQVAIRVGYLDPSNPGRFNERLRRLLARKDMWEDEVQMLRGLCTEIERRT